MPTVPIDGVPARTPVAGVKVTPVGSVPDRASVGAGFAAAELFVLQIFGATRSLLSPGLWRSGIEFAAQNAPQAVAGLLAAASCLAIGGFFVVRHGLRYVNRRRPRLAAGFAAFFIASFAALVIAAFLHQPCGC